MAPTSPRLSQAVGDPQTCELWLSQHQNSHPSCPKSGAVPVMHQDTVAHLGSTGKMGTLLTHTLQDLFCWKRSSCFLVCSGTRTHHCHQRPAVKRPSACTARCLHSILKKYIPHLLQRYAPDTSILWAGSGLGPWTWPSSHVSSIQNKCPTFFLMPSFSFCDGGCLKLLQELTFVTLWITLCVQCYKKNAV